jgi:hypothetical protein
MVSLLPPMICQLTINRHVDDRSPRLKPYTNNFFIHPWLWQNQKQNCHRKCASISSIYLACCIFTWHLVSVIVLLPTHGTGSMGISKGGHWMRQGCLLLIVHGDCLNILRSALLGVAFGAKFALESIAKLPHSNTVHTGWCCNESQPSIYPQTANIQFNAGCMNRSGVLRQSPTTVYMHTEELIIGTQQTRRV